MAKYQTALRGLATVGDEAFRVYAKIAIRGTTNPEDVTQLRVLFGQWNQARERVAGALALSEPLRRLVARKALSPRQLEIVSFLDHYWLDHGIMPTLQEIADHMGTTRVTVFEHVTALRRKRILVRDPRITRGLRWTKPVLRQLQAA